MPHEQQRSGLVTPDAESVAMLSWYDQPPLQRKNSLPHCTSLTFASERPRGKSAPGVPPSLTADATDDAAAAAAAPRRRGFSLARPQSAPIKMSIGKNRRRRKVTFKNMYSPDVMPAPTVESYDDLVFNVAGLFHTMSFLHDPEDWGEDPTSGSISSEEYEPEPPLERSVPLMIAEFLYRSAVYLGYRAGETPWLPGFREDKGFSGNDVKRWRRLAHFDWEGEEQEFQKKRQEAEAGLTTRPQLESTDSTTSSLDANWHNHVLANIGSSFRLRRQDSTNSVDSVTSSSSQSQDGSASRSGKAKFRRAVSGWIHKHRRQSSRHNESILQQQLQQQEEPEPEGENSERHRSKHKPVSWLNPPPISKSKDLDQLVDIINSCVYCGQFQFKKRDIVALCNVKI
ncbi:hypothetical protein PHYBOEH_006071 [Phytophthora boehmeriae]|uniref:Uncharacterized protein n=1 Tax=Phytophthora boehmeriae TaxID=109152 RepID=A0A8T1WHX5_9STRA|nr:hypothetical protein PHYBOEH_006071 [Phytophthora boehmeriae]